MLAVVLGDRPGRAWVNRPSRVTALQQNSTVPASEAEWGELEMVKGWAMPLWLRRAKRGTRSEKRVKDEGRSD